MTSVFVNSGILYAGFSKGFLALHAGAAFAAMMLTTLVATPRLRVVDTQFLAAAGNIAFGYVGIWRQNLDAQESAVRVASLMAFTNSGRQSG